MRYRQGAKELIEKEFCEEISIRHQYRLLLIGDSSKIKQRLTGSETLRANQATAEDFFTAFKTLRNKEKEAFLEKVINDPELKEDLIDIALIEKAREGKGQINLCYRIFFKTPQGWKSCLSSYLVKLMPQAQKDLDGFRANSYQDLKK